jgi:uncharacterized protein
VTSAVAAIAEAIDGAPVVDAHDHLRSLDDLRPMTFTKLLEDSFVHIALRTPDGSPNALGNRLDVPLERDTWETVNEATRRVRTNSFYRWLLTGTCALHNVPLEGAELTRAHWEQLTYSISRQYETSDWLANTLDRANVKATLTDPFWRPGATAMADPRSRPSFRISSAMAAYHPEASDYEGTNLIRDWSAAFDVHVTTLDALETLVDRVLESNLAAGARSLKLPNAYERTLAIGAVSRNTAAHLFGRHPSDVSAAERNAFGDYVLRFVFDRAREHDLVVQVHLGLARLEHSHPIALVPLLREFPEIVFDLFHGGYPWTSDVAALAHSYPNVRLNLVWLPLISTEIAVAALRQWIQVMPQSDRISWGSDARTAEEAYGALLAGKHTVARAVGHLVDDGYFPLSLGIETAESILAGAATRIYRL